MLIMCEVEDTCHVNHNWICDGKWILSGFEGKYSESRIESGISKNGQICQEQNLTTKDQI